jgi:hypothetical protein
MPGFSHSREAKSMNVKALKQHDKLVFGHGFPEKLQLEKRPEIALGPSIQRLEI